MKLSQLIARCAVLLSEHGDLDIVVNDSDGPFDLEDHSIEVESIEPVKSWHTSIKNGDVKTVVIG